MNWTSQNNRRTFEFLLILIVLAMTGLLVTMQEHKMVILYLFFLPVVLSGYFLGRMHAGLLAVLSAVTVTVVLTLDSSGYAAYTSHILVGLTITVWAGVLGLTALLVGTLCDERAAKVLELHTAYVGVVEVLARYLQSANPKVKARSSRVAELSQAVAERMKRPQKEIDDIRVGALLYDIGNIEITTQLIGRAVGTLEAGAAAGERHTFQGIELVHSLEPVLSGAVPLLLSQDQAVQDRLTVESGFAPHDVPIGAAIIRAVRAYDVLIEAGHRSSACSPADAIRSMRSDPIEDYDAEVLAALESCETQRSAPQEELIHAS